MSKNTCESTKCKRCGRQLKSPEAIALGMGRTCWLKSVEEHRHKKLFTIPVVYFDNEDVE